MTSQNKEQSKLSDLIIAIFEHEDAPDWLLGVLHDGISDNSILSAFEPDYIKGMLKGTEFYQNEVARNER